MKIEQTSVSLPAKTQQKITPSAEPAPIASQKNAENLNTQTTRERISQWFAQIGIAPDEQGRHCASIDNRVLKRDKLAAHRKLRNIESVLEKALNFCIEDNKDEQLDPDWFFNFVKMAEEIYSPAMQELWGKIFAVETSRPGSFSLRTLQTLKLLTHKDAQIFRHAVTLASRRHGEQTPKLIIGYQQKPSVWSLFSLRTEHNLNLGKFGLGYPDLLSLMDLGLIYQSEIESGELAPNSAIEWKNSGQSFQLTARKPGTILIYYKFTSTGAELFTLVGVNQPGIYLDELKRILRNGLVVS